MKGILGPLALLVAILGFALWNGRAITEKTEALRRQLQQSSALAQEEDWPAVESVLAKSYRDWSRWQAYLRMVAPHSAAAEAEALYVRALALAQARESSELQAELAELRERLRLLAEMEQYSLQNIL